MTAHSQEKAPEHRGIKEILDCPGCRAALDGEIRTVTKVAAENDIVSALLGDDEEGDDDDGADDIDIAYTE